MVLRTCSQRLLKEPLIKWLRRRIAALRGARFLAYLLDMWLRPLRLTPASPAIACTETAFSRSLCAARLALHPPRSLNQRFLTLWLGSLLLIASFAIAAQEGAWNETNQKRFDNNPNQVLIDSREALRKAKSSGDEAGELNALYLLTTATAETEKTNAPEDIARGEALSRKLGDMSALCWFLFYRASTASELVGDSKGEAAAALDEAEAIGERRRLYLCQVHVLMHRGYIRYRQGRYSDALEQYTKAYQLAESHQYKYGMAHTMFRIGGINGAPGANAESLAKAADYYNRAFNLLDPEVYRSSRILFSEGLALTYYRLKELSKARELYEKTLVLANEMPRPWAVARIHFRLGQIAKDEGRFADALDHVDKALPGLPNPTDNFFYVSALLVRAEALGGLGRKKESIETLSQGRAAMLQSHNPVLEVEFYKRAAEVYARLGSYDAAYQQMETLWAANKRLAQAANAKVADELKVRFDVQLKETENALLKSQQKEAETRRLALMLALAFSLLLLGSLAFYLRRRASVAQMEAKHQSALAAAESRANQAKSVFLANMSHELRSPLNAMLGFSRLLMRDASVPSEAKKDLGIVLKSGEHLYTLINQVLDLSKIEAGRTTMQESNLDLYALVDEIANMFALVAKDKGVSLLVDCTSETPPFIRVDAVKLRQVLVNLMSNAFKFTAQGSVTLRVEKVSSSSPLAPLPRAGEGNQTEGCRLLFAVVDTGPGIAAEELGHLGEAFVQAQAGRQAKEGTGLGLAISRSFVRLMGGELKLASEVGKGTAISFDIPVQIVKASDVTAKQEHPQVVGLAANQPKYRILAVDDKLDSRQLLVRLLTPLGFEVRDAGNGKEAIEIWEAWEPHLIWMDMRMPVMDGREATRRIKATEKGRATKIIALTASSFEEEREQIIAVGCDDFLRKPFREGLLFEMMQKHLGVEFIYETGTATDVAAPDVAQLAALPIELRDQLQTALQNLDVGTIDSVVAKIREIDPTLAAALDALAKNFHYMQLLGLLQGVKGKEMSVDSSETR